MVAGDDRRRERLEQERPLLEAAFLSVTLDAEAGVVIVRGHRLPRGWSHNETDVLVEIPEKYPSTPPDNMCARADLRLADGQMPQGYQGQRQIGDRQWLQFSYHIEPSDWHPDIDVSKSTTLVDYIHGALSRFEEAT